MRRMFHRAVVSLLVPAALVAGGIIGAGPTLAAAPCVTVWELTYPTSFPLSWGRSTEQSPSRKPLSPRDTL